MAFITLKKLYYADPKIYIQEYEKRFSSEEAVKLNFYIEDNQAFFLVNREVLQLAYDIAKTDKEVASLSRQLPGIAKMQYSKKCLIDEIVITNKIEGVRSSRKEIGEALDILQQQAKKRNRTVRFESLVKKYLKLTTEEKIQIDSCKDIRDIYDEIFLKEVVEENKESKPDGELFRKGQTAIYDGAGEVIHNGIYPEKKIMEAVEQALGFLKDESVDNLYRICLFHYLIEYIHPFYDGNGRLGRFILSYCISRELEPLLAYRLSETIKENISKYYKAFEICNDPRSLGDLTPFLLMQLEMIHIAIKELKESLLRKLISWDRYERIIPTLPGSKDKSAVSQLYSYLIQAALFSESGISTAELTKEFGVSYGTLRNMLKKIPQDFVIAGLKGKVKYYQINLKKLDQLLFAKE